jgi:glycosyltransferase involved in cell wall biosynthesis
VIRPLRVLLLNWRDPRNPEAGGAEVHLHEVAKRLCAEGFSCVQVSHAFPGAPAEETLDGVRILRLGGKFLFNFTVALNLRRWCEEHRIEVVLDDSNKVALLSPWLCGKPVVLQLHHLFGKAIFRETAWPLALYVLFFERLMPFCYRKTRVLTGSESSRRELLSKGFRRVEIAPEGVNLSDYALPVAPPRRAGLVLYLGRVKRYKGLDAILRALSRLREKRPEARLAVAGTGDALPGLCELARNLGLEASVDFLGFVDERRKVELYHEAEVVVNSSLKEGWGLTSIEANACGTPVVAADVPGLCDSVRHGETGFLVPFGDAGAFAAALDRLLGDAELWRRLSAGARKWAEAHSWEPAYRVTRAALLSAREEAHAGN